MGGAYTAAKPQCCTNGTAADPYVRVALLSEKFWCWQINITLNAIFCQIVQIGILIDIGIPFVAYLRIFTMRNVSFPFPHSTEKHSFYALCKTEQFLGMFRVLRDEIIIVPMDTE